jgi:hypothetical protein
VADRPFRKWTLFIPPLGERCRSPTDVDRRILKEALNLESKRIIYIDVDDTLVRTFGTKQIPMTSCVDYVRRMYAAGHQLYCWSRGGAEYSLGVAISLGIADCFLAFLPKPDVVLDDRGAELLDHCEFILPSNEANH